MTDDYPGVATTPPMIEDLSNQVNPQEIPKVLTWHVCVYLPAVQEKTKGGLYLPDQTRSEQEYLTNVGKIVALGPKAFQDPKLRIDGDEDSIPKIGDWIFIGQHSGIRFRTNTGHQFKVLSDSAIVAKIDRPDRYFLFV